MLQQSREDRRGRANADGWGIAWFEKGEPHVDKRAFQAAADPRFRVDASHIRARTLVAHVRAATVGDTRNENVHPFAFGPWVFAHNGTIPAFDAIEPSLLGDLPGVIRQHRRGTTDSELLFLWLLARLAEHTPNGTPEAPPAIVAEVVRTGLRHVRSLCARRTSSEATLNFVLADSRMLLASRRGRRLFSLQRQVLGTCELCGTCHCPKCHRLAKPSHPTVDRLPCRAVIVASEPLTDEDWTEEDDDTLLIVDDSLTTRRLAL